MLPEHKLSSRPHDARSEPRTSLYLPLTPCCVDSDEPLAAALVLRDFNSRHLAALSTARLPDELRLAFPQVLGEQPQYLAVHIVAMRSAVGVPAYPLLYVFCADDEVDIQLLVGGSTPHLPEWTAERIIGFLDQMGLAYYRTNRAHRTIFSSGAEQSILGPSGSRLAQQDRSLIYVDPDHRSAFLTALAAGDGKVVNYRCELRDQHGKVCIVRTCSRTIIDSSRSVVGVDGVYRVVTQDEAEASLNDRLRALRASLEDARTTPHEMIAAAKAFFGTEYVEVWSVGDETRTPAGATARYLLLREFSGFRPSDLRYHFFYFHAGSSDGPPFLRPAGSNDEICAPWLSDENPHAFSTLDTVCFATDIQASYGLDDGVSIPICGLGPERPIHHYLFVYRRAAPTFYSLLDEATRASDVLNAAYARRLQLDDEDTQQQLFTLSGRTDNLDSFLLQVLPVIRTVTGCTACSIFLLDESDHLYRLAATTGLVELKKSQVPKRQVFYRAHEGITGSLASGALTRLSFADILNLTAFSRLGKFNELEPERCRGWLGIQLRTVTGRALGVIRCLNRQVTHDHPAFARQDVHNLESLSRFLGAAVDIYQSQERIAQTLEQVTHETMAPVAAIHGIADQKRRRYSRYNDYERQRAFAQIGDMAEYTKLQLGTKPLVRERRVVIDRKPIDAQRMIFQRAVHLMKPFARDRDFPPEALLFRAETDLPQIMGDRIRLLQLVLNILGNAIKYARDTPAEFSATVTSRAVDSGYEVAFEDWGVGIPEQHRDSIWEFGVRLCHGAGERQIAGQGMGCFIAKMIADAHGFGLRVDNCRGPTRLVLAIPKAAIAPVS